MMYFVYGNMLWAYCIFLITTCMSIDITNHASQQYQWFLYANKKYKTKDMKLLMPVKKTLVSVL